MEQKVNLKQIALFFLKLGFTAFGGPAVHISIMQQELVEKKKWLSNAHFLDLISATNLIPGPNSTEMAIHIGYEKGGWKGLILAGVCFIFPASLITLFFAYLYKKFEYLPETHSFTYGIKAGIIAIILSAIFPLIKQSFKNNTLLLIGIGVLIGTYFQIGELYLLISAGILYTTLKSNKSLFNKQLLPIIIQKTGINLSINGLNTKLFFIFLKVGAILYGSGYVLFVFLNTELVETNILTHKQLVDAIAVGQFTPGPVFSAVTFIGYQINDMQGAIISTIAIFVPSFIFVAFLPTFIKKVRNSTFLSHFLDAINIASIAFILSICITMGSDIIFDWKSILILLISILITFKYKKINSFFIVIGSSFLGYLLLLF